MVNVVPLSVSRANRQRCSKRSRVGRVRFASRRWAPRRELRSPSDFRGSLSRSESSDANNPVIIPTFHDSPFSAALLGNANRFLKISVLGVKTWLFNTPGRSSRNALIGGKCSWIGRSSPSLWLRLVVTREKHVASSRDQWHVIAGPLGHKAHVLQKSAAQKRHELSVARHLRWPAAAHGGRSVSSAPEIARRIEIRRQKRVERAVGASRGRSCARTFHAAPCSAVPSRIVPLAVNDATFSVRNFRKTSIRGVSKHATA
jgi:hypothetical protein